jgi:hypothetical protein
MCIVAHVFLLRVRVLVSMLDALRDLGLATRNPLMLLLSSRSCSYLSELRYRFSLSLFAKFSIVLFHAWQALSSGWARWFLPTCSDTLARSHIRVRIECDAEIHSRNNWRSNVEEFEKKSNKFTLGTGREFTRQNQFCLSLSCSDDIQAWTNLAKGNEAAIVRTSSSERR